MQRVVHLSASDDMTSEADADKGEPLRGDDDQGDLHANQDATEDDDFDKGEIDRDDADHSDADRGDSDKGDADKGDLDKGDADKGDLDRGEAHQGDGEEDLDVFEIEDVEPFWRMNKESEVVLLAEGLVADILSRCFSSRRWKTLLHAGSTTSRPCDSSTGR